MSSTPAIATSGRRSGGTWQGYLLGSVGALIILWLALLAIRKRRYASRLGSLRGWTSAHVYLGCALLIVATLHCAFQFGWNVHTLAYALMCLVIGSGLVGLYQYLHVPKLIAENLQGSSRARLFAELLDLDKQIRRVVEGCAPPVHAAVGSSIEKTTIGGGVWAQLFGRDRSMFLVLPEKTGPATLKRNVDQQAVDRLHRRARPARRQERRDRPPAAGLATALPPAGDPASAPTGHPAAGLAEAVALLSRSPHRGPHRGAGRPCRSPPSSTGRDMDVLMRELRDAPGGIAAYRDTEIASKELSIGCGPDQQIQLLGRKVGARHAVIRSGGRPLLVCLGGARVTIKGKERRSRRLQIGDRIEIGGHDLTIAQPPAGFDLAIELRLNQKIDSSDFEAAFRTGLHQTWLSKRRGAWLLGGAVALFGFAVPFGAIRARRIDQGAGAQAAAGLSSLTRQVAALAPAVRTADALWSSGPLGPGHGQIIGDECATCHTTPFETVKDAACSTCHKGATDHVERSRLAETRLGPPQDCVVCHREHEEPSQLIDRTDRFCVDCHAAAHEAFGPLKLQVVAGFGTGRHPPFGAKTLLAAARAETGLKFSHPQHLDGVRVRNSEGKGLGCADCHQLAGDGEHFAPTTMAANCASCHELTFDPDAPDRQLPHGKPRDIVRTLQDYFVRKRSEGPGAVAEQRPGRERRRLPGRSEKAEVSCRGSAFECGMAAAADEIRSQFGRRGCVSCHVVEDTGRKDLIERFAVKPIELATDYYLSARFPHRSHLVQGGLAGDKACLTCHPANQAGGDDLLLPDLPVCETCHSDNLERDRLRLQCVSCHAYHPRS